MIRLKNPLRRAALAITVGIATLGGLISATPHIHAQSSAAASGTSASPQTEHHIYDVTVRGIRAATVTMASNQTGNRYATRALIETTGLGAALRRVRFDAEATGTIRATGYAPARYAEDADTGKRHSVSVIEYRRGVPNVVSYRADRDHRLTVIDPATQGGTLDPMTSLYAILRDMPRARACTQSVTSFDGRRRTETRLIAATAQGDMLLCTGEYRRIAGYTDKEMSEKTRFPFTMTYAPLPDGRMRVIEVSLDTLYGKAMLKRR